MARETCPSCGSPYNGKTCRNCLYTHFTEEIAHGTHTHKGEPLIIDTPVRRPIPQKNPFGCEKKTRRKNPLARFMLLLTLIYSLLPMVRDWGLELKAREHSSPTATVRPEPLVVPEDRLILHDEAYIQIFVSAEDTRDLNDGLCLYVQNTGIADVTVSAGDMEVNGCPMPHSMLVCKAGANAVGKGWLELDAEDLKASEIQECKTLSFTLTALQNSRILFDTGEILLTAEGAEAYE